MYFLKTQEERKKQNRKRRQKKINKSISKMKNAEIIILQNKLVKEIIKLEEE